MYNKIQMSFIMEHKQELGHKEPRRSRDSQQATTTTINTTTTSTETETEQDVSFFHDFIAGGIAGSASVVVGHPMDTLKVRMQTAKGNPSISSLAVGAKYGGPATLFRGMAAPLSSACVVNALIFSSYGWSTRLYDQNSEVGYNQNLKAFTCGSFGGLVQALIICPMEHVKCRLQISAGGTAATSHPLRTTLQAILASGGGGSSAKVSALYRGWWITCWREVPAFGAYFTLYDIFKDRIQDGLNQREARAADATSALTSTSTSTSMAVTQLEQQTSIKSHAAMTTAATTTTTTPGNSAHTWIASALAGGTTGALTWAMVYPFDVIKTQIQTAPIDTPKHQRTITAVVTRLVREHGWRHLFRGLSVTCLRAFPVNGIIFPVYEYTLMQCCAWES